MLVGLATGLGVSLVATPFLRSLLFGVKPADTLTYAGVAAVLCWVALAACYIPAWRATKVEPMVALRCEWSMKLTSVKGIQFAVLIVGACLPLSGQDNYEIQVYAYDTVAPGRTMVELHSNFTFEGFKTSEQGMLPDEHQTHETIEITQGWTSWFETGLYIFTSYGPHQGYKWVGDHIRPRVRVPEKWHWPVGVSLSTEFGYQRPIFSADTWTWEIRPIVDKQWKSWYLSFNPALERSFHGPSVSEGVGFSPNFKAAYSVTRKLSAGLEYYGSLGPVTGFSPSYLQQQQIVPTIDYDFGPNWEFNLGVGVGVTRSTDHLLVKMIIGRRFRFITPRLPRIGKAKPAGGEG